MQDRATEGTHRHLAAHPPPQRSAYKRLRRLVGRVYWIVGGIANLLAIYTFGESRHWWGATFSVSPKTQEILWMLSIGIGGPWAMILGAVAGAKLMERFTKDRVVTTSIVSGAVKAGSFFAILHCAQMSFDMKIFPRYLNSEGFFKVVGTYLLVGIAIGTLCPLIVYAVRRVMHRTAATSSQIK